MKTYTKLELEMDWTFIKDKQIDIMPYSNEEFGMIYILDSDDEVVKMIAYELINNNKDEKL